MRPLSLRVRITSGALVVVAVSLSLAGVIVIEAVQRQMTAQIDAALEADADFTQRAVTTGSGLPMGEGPTDLYVQFVDGSGAVIGSGTAATGRPALSAPSQRHGTIATVTDPVLGPLRVLVGPAPSAPKVTLVLARSSEQVAQVHDRLVRLLVVLVVVGSGLMATLVWFVVGRALRPVERMRRSVEGLDDHDLRTRVERPGTGDELDRLAGTLNELLARLEAAVEREHRFITDASHDLRTPIAAIRALLETEPPSADASADSRADAMARLDQLQSLVDQLLTLGSVDDGVMPSMPVDLDDLVLAQARQLARRSDLRIDTSRVSGGQVVGRDTDLDRLVENLASNATRYASSTVSFAVHQDAGTVVLVVEDDGPGIAPGDRAAVFERFRTLDPARSLPDSGTGLGLAIAAAIVDAHHGTIDLTDAAGGGARFEVRLPAFEPHRPRPPAPVTRHRS